MPRPQVDPDPKLTRGGFVLQTLFVIPETVYGWPLFGLGILFWLWSVGSAIWILVRWKQLGWVADIQSMLLTNGLVALLIWFVLPHIVVEVDGVRGIPLRGYGLMLMLGVVAGVGLALYRGERRGFSPDTIMNLAFYLFISGILGARAFYVIQKWDQFSSLTWVEMVQAISNFTQGGLVVYGALLGAMVGFVLFVVRNQVRTLELADVIAPSLLVGLSLGRIGCLLNGCCFGGPCELPWSVRFPPASPPYETQFHQGRLLGLTFHDADAEAGAASERGVVIGSVFPDTPAALADLRTGMRVMSVNGVMAERAQQAWQVLAESPQRARLEVRVEQEANPRIVNLSWNSPPPRSLPTEPTQLYSAGNAALLCMVALAVESRLKRPGLLIAFIFGVYAVTRFLEEIIRQDEGSFWGTGLTVSQNVSIALLLFAIGLALWIVSRTHPRPGELRSLGVLLVAGSLFSGGAGCQRWVASEPAADRPTLSFTELVSAAASSAQPELIWTAKELSVEDWRQVERVPQLRRLQITHAVLPGDALELLSQLTALEELRLEQMPVDDVGISHIARLPQLQRLNLPHGDFTDAGLRQLAQLPRLELLRFHSARVTDEALSIIAGSRQLRFLHLIDVPITDESLSALVGMSQLESLYIDGGRVTEEGLSELVSARPDLHLHWNLRHLPSDPQRDHEQRP